MRVQEPSGSHVIVHFPRAKPAGKVDYYGTSRRILTCLFPNEVEGKVKLVM